MTITTKLSSNNFLRQFRTDENSEELDKLSSVQFMEVWEHYDKDGNNQIISTVQDDEVFIILLSSGKLI